LTTKYEYRFFILLTQMHYETYSGAALTIENSGGYLRGITTEDVNEKT